MTVLQRTDLTTSQKIQCAAAAVAGQHAHGSKTALSETYEISRPTVYAVGAAAESVLRNHFEAPLLQGAAVDVRVDDAQLRRAVVALRVLAPNAIRPIEDLVGDYNQSLTLAPILRTVGGWISSIGHTRTLCELSVCQIAFGNSSSHRCFLRDFLSVSCGGGAGKKRQ